MTFKNYFQIYTEGKHRSQYLQNIGFTSPEGDFLDDTDVDVDKDFQLKRDKYSADLNLTKTSQGWNTLTTLKFVIPQEHSLSPRGIEFVTYKFNEFFSNFEDHNFHCIEDPNFEIFIDTHDYTITVQVEGSKQFKTLAELEAQFYPIEKNMNLFYKRLTKVFNSIQDTLLDPEQGFIKPSDF